MKLYFYHKWASGKFLAWEFQYLKYLHFEWGRILVRFEWRAPCPPSSRAYLVLAIEPWSAMLQLYRPGAFLGCHTDRERSTPTLAVELWSPKEGRLECQGPHIRFFDLVLFDGADPHEVTPCSGHRVSLLFQLATKTRRFRRLWHKWAD